MGLPSDLSRMEIQGVMEALGYIKSMLPTAADVYIRQEDRIVIDCNDQWRMPINDLVRILLDHGIGSPDVEDAYNAVYDPR